MNIDKIHHNTLLRAVTAAVRYAHLEKSSYDIRTYASLHRMVVSKAFRSKEMQDENWLPRSIMEGTDLGLEFTKAKIIEENSIISAEEARMILASFNSWEQHADQGEAHWTFTEQFKNLKKKIKALTI